MEYTLADLKRATVGTLMVDRSDPKARVWEFWNWLDENGQVCQYHEAERVWLKNPRTRAPYRCSLLLVDVVGGRLKNLEKGS